MTGKNQHVIKTTDGWAVKGEGNSKATSVHKTQAQAIESARKISINQKSELIIHNEKGQISRKDSHGKDPFPPKG